ncbi:MAG TPA: hypothetical protein VFK02_28285 [Kofleriaceae bacterium]|nr:hypothetical protein [Kofleriaceae bacterium]
MPERALLEAVRGYLASAVLTPAVHGVGVVEPAGSSDLPAVVLSLEATSRDGLHVGRRATTVTAPPPLRQTPTISLAAPFLPEAPGVSLVSPDGLELTLPHGGLVRADGTPGEITGADLTCTLDGTPRPVTTVTPTGAECRCDPVEGTLQFATALPGSGTLALSYFLGRWEQELTRLTGTLRVDVVGSSAATVADLTDQIIGLLTGDAARRAIQRLMAIEVTAISSVAADLLTSASRRTTRLRFAFEHERNTPESSGRVIRSIPIDASLS